MKNLKSILFFSFAIFILASCGNDDNNSATPADVDGEWTAISFNATIIGTTTVAGSDPFTTTFRVDGSNMNYDLDLNGGNFTTSGNYTITTTGENSVGSIPETSTNYSNVSGSGDYTVDGSVIMVSGSFFELELDGVMMSDFSGPSEANYAIDSDGQLTFSQDQTIDQSGDGFTSSTQLTSTSVWVRR